MDFLRSSARAASWLLCGVAWALSACVQAQPAPTVTKTTYTYRSIGLVQLKADVYDPSVSQWGPQRPVLLFVHGGGWACGNRDAFVDAPRWIAENYGVVTVSAEYRLAPIMDAVVENGHIVSAPDGMDGCTPGSFPYDNLGLPDNRAAFPAQLEDLQTLMWQLRLNAPALRINPNKIAVLGASAGGHLAGMLGATNAVMRADSGTAYSSRANALVSVSGPWDLSAVDQVTNPSAVGILRNLFGGTPTLQQLQQASPGLQNAGVDFPMTLFIHGAADTLVPASQSVQACARMVNCFGGQPVIVETPAGVDPHDTLYLLQARLDQLVAFMAAFISAPVPMGN